MGDIYDYSTCQCQQRAEHAVLCDQTSQVLDTRGPRRLQRGASEHRVGTIFIQSNAKVHFRIQIFQSNVQSVKNNFILTLLRYQIKHCTICFCNKHNFMNVTFCTLYMLPQGVTVCKRRIERSFYHGNTAWRWRIRSHGSKAPYQTNQGSSSHYYEPTMRTQPQQLCFPSYLSTLWKPRGASHSALSDVKKMWLRLLSLLVHVPLKKSLYSKKRSDYFDTPHINIRGSIRAETHCAAPRQLIEKANHMECYKDI